MNQSTPKPADRRSHPRVALDWPLSVSLDDGTFEARLRDISRAGVCFFLDRRIPEMTILRMSIDLPGGGAGPVEGSGVVVRCQKLSPHIDHYEVAVFLNDLSDESRAALETYVSGVMAAS